MAAPSIAMFSYVFSEPPSTSQPQQQQQKVQHFQKQGQKSYPSNIWHDTNFQTLEEGVPVATSRPQQTKRNLCVKPLCQALMSLAILLVLFVVIGIPLAVVITGTANS